MRLQRVITRKRGQKTYYKYLIIVPPEIVEILGWKDGLELAPEVRGKVLLVKPA